MESRAFGYVRCSTGQQVESGLGLEAQRASVEDCAKKLGLPLAAIFEDGGLSGGLALADRPGLLDAVAALQSGDRLIVAARSRLGRDVVNVALIEREVAKRGAKVVSALGEGTDLDDGPTADLVKTLLDGVNAWERSQAALRTRAALRAKRARGEALGNPPYGLRAVGGRVEPEPREQETIALIHELRHAGLSERAIAAELQLRGVRGRTDKPLSHVQVHRVLARAA